MLGIAPNFEGIFIAGIVQGSSRERQRMRAKGLGLGHGGLGCRTSSRA